MTGSEQPAGAPLRGSRSVAITHESTPEESLLAGFANYGLAGLTAVDYLVEHLDLRETGHVSVDALPAITPFEEGIPRHHTRFFSRPDLDVTVLVGELFVPQQVAPAFASAITGWLDEHDVREVTVLSGVPIPHGPDAHRAFYVATEDYRERRLAGGDVAPMGAGFLEGLNAELVARGIDSPLATGVFVTPVHAQVPDVEAAIRLLDAFQTVYGVDVDTAPLEGFASEISRYYEELQQRVESAGEERRPDDGMYM